MKKNTNLSSNVKYVSIVTYLSNEQLEEAILKRKAYITGFAYINHEPDDSDKVPHTHVQINSTRSRRMSDYLGWLKGYIDEKGLPINSRIEETLSIAGVHDYFLHNRPEDAGKHQYNEQDIKILTCIADPWGEQTKLEMSEVAIEEMLAKKEANADDCEQMIDDIISMIPSRQMARKYGRDYMKNFKSYRQFASMVVMEETADIELARKIAGDEIGYINQISNQSYVSGITTALQNMKMIVSEAYKNNVSAEEAIRDFLGVNESGK